MDIKRSWFVSFFFLLMLIQWQVSDAFYQWVDENGQVHVTDYPKPTSNIHQEEPVQAQEKNQGEPARPAPNAPTVTASNFAKEVSKETYKQTNPPSKTPVFRWDFSKAQVEYNYIYEQQVQGKASMESLGGKPDTGQEMSAKGTLLIKSQGDKTADFVLKDVLMTMKMYVGEKKPETMEQHLPPLVMQGIKEDGSGSFGDSSQDMLLKMLFPLPPQSLKVGESVNIPAQMPFNAMGSVLHVKGRSRITLSRYVKIGNRTCAQFDVDTDISDLRIPPELKGDYKCFAKGTSVFYFDIANRAFVSGVVALIMQFSIDAPMPEMKITGENSVALPKTAKMSMTSDNLIKVRLKE